MPVKELAEQIASAHYHGGKLGLVHRQKGDADSAGRQIVEAAHRSTLLGSWVLSLLKLRVGDALTARDMQAWTAARMIGEAASRANSGDPKSVFDFLKGADFSIAAFKGQRLTLRDWNLQLRQPILLVDGRMVVSVSPQEGFLHQYSELDTLGVDRPETKCKLSG